MNIIKNNTYIIVFDFDLTLTKYHSGGLPNKFNNYFGSNNNDEKIYNMLTNLKINGYKLYINSRGIKNYLLKYFQYHSNTGLYNWSLLFNKYNIYGAIDINDVKKHNWHIRKVLYLDEIVKINNAKKNNIIFIDDTKINIDEALKNGYKNSIHIKFNSNTFPTNLFSITDKLLI